jgi:elongation factor Ts
MNITAAQVNELRQKTGAGMMDCKKALLEAEGNIEKAIEILRKKGAAVAAKRADRDAKEGIILTKISESKNSVAIVEVNCETDFVAKSADFVNYANEVLETAFSSNPASVADLFEKNPKLDEGLTELVGKVGEKSEVSRVAVLTADNGLVVDYIHPGSKLGVVVRYDNLPSEKFSEFEGMGKDFAMQVAAMKPLAIYREEVPQDIVNSEIEIYKEVARKEGKPEQILEKIAQGKLNKYYQENCLSEQIFIKDNSKTVIDLVNEFNKLHGTTIKIHSFLRFHLGDEKK